MGGELEAVEGVQREFAGADLGDGRLERRLKKVVGSVAAAPSKGFPQVMASSAELEALYLAIEE